MKKIFGESLIYKESTFTSISMNRAKLNEGWNYGAITWEKTGKDTYKEAHYVNGTEIESTDRQYRYIKKMHSKSIIQIGKSRSYFKKTTDSGSLAIIDSFKISKRALTADEIKKSAAAKGLTEDKDTLLFCDFSKLKANKRFNLDKAIQNPKMETGKTAHKRSTQRGIFYGPYEIIEGRNDSKAIKMFAKTK